MLFTILSLLVTVAKAQNSTIAEATQIAVYPPFPIRNGTNMQHIQRAYEVSFISAISTTTLVYAISCSPLTTMTRFNDVCGTSYVPNIITVTESPDEWHWSAQGKSLECTNLREKTKTCTSITNNYGSNIAPGTQDGSDFLAGFLEYFTTMTPVAVNLTAGFGNVPATVLESLENDATGLVNIQTSSLNGTSSRTEPTSTGVSAASLSATSPSGPTGISSSLPGGSSTSALTQTTNAAPRATGAVGLELLFGAAGVVGAGIFGL
ncbi:uncharacterized protein EKO05_0007885 [Ascochyta rabiei]|uniref:uncharacterized protein n=1 Tax=Didymella rabiei TaxID=5454 RepID=UPI00220D9D1E|nr:uncharacterized protein EKO05_0007885 [Ascochyta rabiei]UPX17536.1 hypothetical protein EKO05_0007885 [Ascochyta rabiei]